jgi:hypothetical protein
MKENVPIIGVFGQLRNGKDTIADYVAYRLKWERSALAKSVKQIFMDTFEKTPEWLEEWKVKPESPPGFGQSVRKSLQFIGDGFRQIKGDIWIDLCFRNLKNPTVISDGRYINEFSKINEVGGVTILVWRPGFENDDPNGSEAQTKPLIDWFSATNMEGPVIAEKMRNCGCCGCGSIPEDCLKVDLFIRNDGTQEDLYSKCDKIVLPFIRKKYGLVH